MFLRDLSLDIFTKGVLIEKSVMFWKSSRFYLLLPFVRSNWLFAKLLAICKVISYFHFLRKYLWENIFEKISLRKYLVSASDNFARIKAFRKWSISLPEVGIQLKNSWLWSQREKSRWVIMILENAYLNATIQFRLHFFQNNSLLSWLIANLPTTTVADEQNSQNRWSLLSVCLSVKLSTHLTFGM